MVRGRGHYLFIGFFFFFSSRRRHTRSDRDWSSDVCSSDLSGASFSSDSQGFDPRCDYRENQEHGNERRLSTHEPCGPHPCPLQPRGEFLERSYGRKVGFLRGISRREETRSLWYGLRVPTDFPNYSRVGHTPAITLS